MPARRRRAESGRSVQDPRLFYSETAGGVALRVTEDDVVAESRCLVTDAILNSENNSAAHIIPSALGGRLKPRGLLSREGNTLLNEKFDVPLVEAYRSLMAVVAGSRDSGETP